MKKSILVLLALFFVSLSVYSQPGSPILVEPINQSTTSRTPYLDWTDVPGATLYSLQIAFDHEFNNPVNLNTHGLTASNYTVPQGALNPNTIYYWRVSADDGILTGPNSSIWSFRTAGTTTQEVTRLGQQIFGMYTSNSISYFNAVSLLIKLAQTEIKILQNQNTAAIGYMNQFVSRVQTYSSSNQISSLNAAVLTSGANVIIELLSINGRPVSGIQEEESFVLMQNFPNPFNPATTINYIIPKKTHVSIKIYDAVGKEVQTLIDKEEDKGTYSVVWDARSFSSGFYFYRITAGNFTAIKQMILLK